MVTGKQERSNDTQECAGWLPHALVGVNIHEFPPWGEQVACPCTLQVLPWPSAPWVVPNPLWTSAARQLLYPMAQQGPWRPWAKDKQPQSPAESLGPT